MSVNRYYQNLIMCGELDYFCLVCKESYLSLSELERHIRWENHKKLVKAAPRVRKFKKDVIYQIRDDFYCEVCNELMSKIEEVSSHIDSDIHKSNKQKPKTEEELAMTKCKRDTGFILVGDAIIDAEHWHCLSATDCLICDKVVTNEELLVHVNSEEHVMRIIRAKITIESVDKCYRMMNKDLFYCFTCRRPMPTDTMDSHWTGPEHSEMKVSVYRATVAASSSTIEERKRELTTKLINSQREFYNICVNTNVAVCKKCNQEFRLDFKEMVNHNKIHAEDPIYPKIIIDSPTPTPGPSDSEDDSEEVVYEEVTDHGKRRADLAKYGKTNHMKLNPGGSRGYCRLCHIYISANMKLFKAHVKGFVHRGHLELMGLKKLTTHTIPDMKYKSITDYMTTAFYARPVHVVWVNRQFCIDVASFILVSEVQKNPHDKTVKCFACDEYYPQGDDLRHYATEEHKKKFLSAKVLCMKGEFIRELRPDVYHCGYCNKLFPFWDVMEKHIETAKHQQKRKDKDLTVKIAHDWFDEKILKKTSKHPDIFYVQLIHMGIIK